ncbi:hypothetical protein LJC57_00735 [Parabacteroides sp. OttesenSCG-928-G07]|nr:hypothetical protein [Parabacteroides sp. OttesenSCG-928-G07]
MKKSILLFLACAGLIGCDSESISIYSEDGALIPEKAIVGEWKNIACGNETYAPDMDLKPTGDTWSFASNNTCLRHKFDAEEDMYTIHEDRKYIIDDKYIYVYQEVDDPEHPYDWVSFRENGIAEEYRYGYVYAYEFENDELKLTIVAGYIPYVTHYPTILLYKRIK